MSKLDEIYALLPDNDNAEISEQDVRDSFNKTFEHISDERKAIEQKITDSTKVKVDKPTADGNWVLSKLGSIFSWVDASNFGKNVANSLLDTIANAGVNMKAVWKIATNSFPFFITGLPDKSSDTTFNKVLVEDSNGQVGVSNGKTIITAMPSVLTDAEKTKWKTEMNGGWTTAGMSVGMISPPIINNNNNNNTWVVLKGANLNLNPVNFSVEIMAMDGVTVVATVPNSQVQLYTIGTDLIFYYNFSNIPLGSYKIRLWNGVAYYVTSLTIDVLNNIIPIDLSSITWDIKEYTPNSNVISASGGNVSYSSKPVNKPYAVENNIVVASALSSVIVNVNEDFYLQFQYNAKPVDKTVGWNDNAVFKASVGLSLAKDNALQDLQAISISRLNNNIGVDSSQYFTDWTIDTIPGIIRSTVSAPTADIIIIRKNGIITVFSKINLDTKIHSRIFNNSPLRMQSIAMNSGLNTLSIVNITTFYKF